MTPRCPARGCPVRYHDGPDRPCSQRHTAGTAAPRPRPPAPYETALAALGADACDDPSPSRGGEGPPPARRQTRRG